MVFNFTQSLGNNRPVNVRRPLFNTTPYTNSASQNKYGGQSYTYKKFWEQFKASPECIAVISVPITDIIGDRPIFVSPDGTQLGRNKTIQANKFWRNNRGKEMVKAMLFDAFVTGDGYLWKGKMSKEDTNKIIKEMVDKFESRLSTKQVNDLAIKINQDEDLKKPKRLDYVASSTMDIQRDEFDVRGYIQRVNGITAKFPVEEIMHFRFMTLNGMIEGFAPLQALSAEIFLLRMIKENMMAYFNNGGTPSKVFTLPEDIANSENHQFLVETLARYNSVANRNGNLVFTGKVDIEDLNSTPKDMEYKDLSLYVTSNIAFAYGIPVSRIPYLIGQSATAGDSGGLAESGYWNRISEIQNQLEDLLNGQMFEEMGFHIRFDRKYKQDEVREAQTESMNAATVQVYQTILRQEGLKLSPKKMSEMLKINQQDLEEMSDKEMLTPQERTGMMNQNLLNDMQVSKEPDAQKRADTKRQVANNQQSNPSGV
tara:strand:+ start:4609 stop:6060 length:1452 start_codon:yes stop_codon:yes gene_type:complete